MKRRNINNIIILLLIIIFSFVYQFFLLDNLLFYVEYITASFFIFVCFIAVMMFGFRKEKDNALKKHINKLMVLFVVFYFSIIYLLGLIFGFLQNSYSLRFITLFNNIVCPLIIIISVEIIRYILIWANKDRKYFHIILSLILTFVEVFYSLRLADFTNLTIAFELITSVILPILCKNLFLSFLSSNVGYKSCLIYRIFLELYVYLVPIIPDLGNYLTSMVGISIPVLLYVYFSRIIDEYYCGIQYEFTDKSNIFIELLKASSVLIAAGMVYGILPYYVLGIGSESMAPFIDKGDAVILHKSKNIENYDVGDVIAFNNDGKVIVHRLVEIMNVNDEILFVTKGDANNTTDDYELYFDDVVGEVKAVIPFFGYPSVYLKEVLEKE